MTSAEYRARYAPPGKAPKPPATPRTPPAPAQPPPAPNQARQPRETAPAAFGEIAVEDFAGVRFVVSGASDALLAELRATCHRYGAIEYTTRHFMQRSQPQSGPKKHAPAKS